MNKKAKIIIVVVIAVITAIAIGVAVSAASKEKQEITTTSTTETVTEAYSKIKSEINSISFDENDKNSLNEAKTKYQSLLKEIESDSNKDSEEAKAVIALINDKIKDVNTKITAIEEKENSTTTTEALKETTTKKNNSNNGSGNNNNGNNSNNTTKKVETTKKETTTKQTTTKKETPTEKKYKPDPAYGTVTYSKPDREQYSKDGWVNAYPTYSWNGESWEYYVGRNGGWNDNASDNEVLKYCSGLLDMPTRNGKYVGEEVYKSVYIWLG